ncbi:helix-turn-helix domain-containing protein [Taibaiella koreensis]|uniref:helix-turn-helix domain-containing protein n=1 Tax=Taibaiella koreensis TaxID=1268548 RepID=UPI001968AD10|nr:AraC family transcriptional regulator [Taibaiella koreensis]
MTTEGIIRPKAEFLQRFLGDETVTADVSSVTISAGIQLHYADVLLCPAQDEPEEMAYMHFYPVADGNYYLQLSFLPECNGKANESYRVAQLVFQPAFFEQWPEGLVCGKQPFRFDRCTEQAFTLNSQGRDALEALIRDKDNLDFIQSLRRQEMAIGLLRFALEAFLVPDEANKLPACSFLSNNSERDKVLETQRLIMEHLDHPMTIRELSREVAMNECYLKKGFKAMFGKTIHEYQQFQRIERAKELLLEGNCSINEVAFKMGFGSASHFSTSFKKIAGMKPCELLR